MTSSIDLSFFFAPYSTLGFLKSYYGPTFLLDAFPLDGETRFSFICENLIFRKRLGVATYF